jgi:hypothetical protein
VWYSLGMSTKNGQLLVSRQQITLVAGPQTIDTGLRQVNQAFGSSSVGEPGLAARTMVIPLAASSSATGDWSLVRVADPTIGPDGTVLVSLTWLGEASSATYNVLFWAPHTLVGPVDAAPYIAPL